jgi:hypothetical protein
MGLGGHKMRKEYDTFVDKLSDLVEKGEVELTIRDLTLGQHKYESRYVRAILSSSIDQLPGGDVLWIRFTMGFLHPKPWAIKITAELGEYQP